MIHRPLKITLSVLALAALIACGGNDPVASVDCSPISAADLPQNNFASACIPGTNSSRRYDGYLYLADGSSNSYLQVTEVNFAPSTSCSGTVTSSPSMYTGLTQGGTTTLAALGADGVTRVTGTGRVMTLDAGESVEGTAFSGSLPFGLSLGESATTQTFALCKRAPSTTASRTIDKPFGNSWSATFTPTFALSGSSLNQTSINTGFSLDGPGNFD